MKHFERECAPFQFALPTRAGTDCVGHLLPAARDSDPNATILRVDGVGAHDHVLRLAMLERLVQMPGAKAILPLVRVSYGALPVTFGWMILEGNATSLKQREASRRTRSCLFCYPSGFKVHLRRKFLGVRRAVVRIS